MIETNGSGFAGAIDFFEFLGEADDWDLREVEVREHVAGGVELAFAAVNEDQVWEFGEGRVFGLGIGDFGLGI